MTGGELTHELSSINHFIQYKSDLNVSAILAKPWLNPQMSFTRYTLPILLHPLLQTAGKICLLAFIAQHVSEHAGNA